MKVTRKDKRRNEFRNNQIDLEANLVTFIVRTGKEQIKKRRKAGLSAYFLKDGAIIEVKPDKTEVQLENLGLKWVSLEKEKRTVILK
jgi:hypothetical protein